MGIVQRKSTSHGRKFGNEVKSVLPKVNKSKGLQTNSAIVAHRQITPTVRRVDFKQSAITSFKSVSDAMIRPRKI